MFLTPCSLTSSAQRDWQAIGRHWTRKWTTAPQPESWRACVRKQNCTEGQQDDESSLPTKTKNQPNLSLLRTKQHCQNTQIKNLHLCCQSLRGGKPSVPDPCRKKWQVLLTLDVSKTLHISMHPKHLSKSYSLATIEHPEPLLLENYPDVAVLVPDLQNVSIDSAKEFPSTHFHHQAHIT